MQFGDLKKESGLKKLNEHLAGYSYIQGNVPTQLDVSTHRQLSQAPAASLAHALRWYRHIGSFGDDERRRFPSATAKQQQQQEEEDDDDDDIDLFGSDDEDAVAERERLKAERVTAYQQRKAAKPAAVAKSSVVLDIKPWDDETDLAQMEKIVRTVHMDGLVWGAGKLVPLAFGIKKLQLMCTVVDAKVSVEELTEKIEEIEDFVQSVDVAAFNKV